MKLSTTKTPKGKILVSPNPYGGWAALKGHKTVCAF